MVRAPITAIPILSVEFIILWFWFEIPCNIPIITTFPKYPLPGILIAYLQV